jgi:hypothetical protein
VVGFNVSGFHGGWVGEPALGASVYRSRIFGQ